jgi:hypothetical protein
MMITKIGKALAVITALALLAMPAHALAQEGESHHEQQPDRGRHLGSNKQHQDGDRDEWYQGQRGHWYQEGNRWQWRGTKGDRGYDKGNRPYYGQSSAQGQHSQALINQDRRLREQYRAAFARGDKNAQKRSMELLRDTDKQLGMTKQQIDAGVIPR